MVVGAADANRVALDGPKARRRLSSVRDAGGCPWGESLDVSAGKRGNATHPLEEVERGALARKKHTGSTGYAAEDGSGGDGHTLCSERLDADARVKPFEGPKEYGSAADDKGLSRDGGARGIRRRVHARLAGQVRSGEVFIEGAVDERIQERQWQHGSILRRRQIGNHKFPTCQPRFRFFFRNHRNEPTQGTATAGGARGTLTFWDQVAHDGPDLGDELVRMGTWVRRCKATRMQKLRFSRSSFRLKSRSCGFRAAPSA
jgi:hypothetical protein